MEFVKFSVGEKVCDPIRGDASIFEITESGAILMLKFQRPTSKEKNNIKSGVAQFKAISIDGVVFFLCRFGTASWIDAPYSKSLSQSTITRPTDGKGLSLHILLIDASTGVLVSQRIVGLTTQFTNALADMIELQPYFSNHSAYLDLINQIYSKYSTEDMVQMGGIKN